DAAAPDQRNRDFFVLAQDTRSGRSGAERGSSLLLFYGVVSRLGGNFFLWQPLFRFADGFLRYRTRDFARPSWGMVPIEPSCDGQSFPSALHVCALESWTNVSMGGAPDSDARPYRMAEGGS